MHELQGRITAHEFGEWWAIYRAEPWGDARSDIAAGMVASTLANINRREHTRPFGPLDFAPYLKPREEAKEMSVAQFVEQARRG